MKITEQYDNNDIESFLHIDGHDGLRGVVGTVNHAEFVIRHYELPLHNIGEVIVEKKCQMSNRDIWGYEASLPRPGSPNELTKEQKENLKDFKVPSLEIGYDLIIPSWNSSPGIYHGLKNNLSNLLNNFFGSHSLRIFHDHSPFNHMQSKNSWQTMGIVDYEINSLAGVHRLPSGYGFFSDSKVLEDNFVPRLNNYSDVIKDEDFIVCDGQVRLKVRFFPTDDARNYWHNHGKKIMHQADPDQKFKVPVYIRDNSN